MAGGSRAGGSPGRRWGPGRARRSAVVDRIHSTFQSRASSFVPVTSVVVTPESARDGDGSSSRAAARASALARAPPPPPPPPRRLPASRARAAAERAATEAPRVAAERASAPRASRPRPRRHRVDGGGRASAAPAAAGEVPRAAAGPQRPRGVADVAAAVLPKRRVVPERRAAETATASRRGGGGRWRAGRVGVGRDGGREEHVGDRRRARLPGDRVPVRRRRRPGAARDRRHDRRRALRARGRDGEATERARGRARAPLLRRVAGASERERFASRERCVVGFFHPSIRFNVRSRPLSTDR